MKKALLFSLLSYFAFVSFDVAAQAWEWARSAGLKGNTNGNAVATDKWGNVYVTGSFSDSTVTFGTTVLHNVQVIGSGGFDIFLAKYDAMGNVLWAKSAGGTESDVAFAITSDDSGNVYISGDFFSDSLMFGTTPLINAVAGGGNEDIFIAKYDPSGNLLWAKSFGTSGLDRPYSLDCDASDNVYLAGEFSGATLQFGPVLLTNGTPGNFDIFVTKFNPLGDVVWAKSAGGIGSDGASSVKTDAYGHLYIAGSFRSPAVAFGATILAATNTFDIFLAKYDTAGNAMWARKEDGGNLGVLGLVATDKQGNVYVTGDFSVPSVTYGATTLLNAGAADLFLIKYDSTGNVLWAKSAGGSLGDIPYGIAIDTSDNVIVTGDFASHTMGFDTATISNGGNNDMFLAKYNATDNLVFATSVENSGNYSNNTSYSICTDIPGNIYISGTYGDSIFAFGAHTLINDSANTANMFLAKWSNSATEAPGIVAYRGNIVLYPNPAADVLTISSPNAITNLAINNILGQTVYNHKYNGKEVIVDVSSLRSGVYIVKNK